MLTCNAKLHAITWWTKKWVGTTFPNKAMTSFCMHVMVTTWLESTRLDWANDVTHWPLPRNPYAQWFETWSHSTPTSCCSIKLPSSLYWVFFVVTTPSFLGLEFVPNMPTIEIGNVLVLNIVQPFGWGLVVY